MATLVLGVPLHEAAIAEAHGPLPCHLGDLLARSPEGAIHKPHAARVSLGNLDHRRVRPVEGDELAVGDQQPKRCALLDDHGPPAIVGAQAEEITVALTRAALDELVSHVVAETKRVEHVLPIAAGQDEGLAVGHLPGHELGRVAPPGIEVDVFDAADVVDRVDEHPPPQRLALDVADQVTLVVRSVDPRVRIEQFHVEHRRILAAHGDRIRVRARHVVAFLFGIVEHHALERAIRGERDEGRSVLAARTLGDQEGRAVVGGLGQSPVAQAVVGGHRLPDPRQRNSRGHAQVSGEEVRAARSHDRAAAILGRGVHRLLESGCVVGLPVAFGPKLPHVERAGNGLSPGHGAK